MGKFGIELRRRGLSDYSLTRKLATEQTLSLRIYFYIGTDQDSVNKYPLELLNFHQ